MPASPRYPRRKGGKCSSACRLAEILPTCTDYFLRYVAYFYRFYVLYAKYHPLLCLAEAFRLGHPFLHQEKMGVNEEQGRGFSCRQGCVSSAFPVAASAEQEARLPPHPIPPCVCATQPSSLREREQEKDLPKTREKSWEGTRNRPEPTGFESSVTNFLPLPCPDRNTVSEGATPARLRRNQLREALLLR